MLVWSERKIRKNGLIVQKEKSVWISQLLIQLEAFFKNIQVAYPSIPSSLVAQIVKNSSAMQETWVWSLRQENPMEKGMVTYTSILACSPPGSSVHGVTESDTTERLSLHFKHSYTYVMIYSNRHVLNDFQVPGLRISRYLSCPALKRSLHCQELNCSQMLYFSGSSRRQYQWLGTRIRKNFNELGFPDSSVGKESNCNAGDPGSIHWRSIPLQYSWTSLVDQLVKKSTLSAGDLGWIPGLGRFPWRRERLPTPVFWPGEFHGLYSPWGCKESDTTERLSLHGSIHQMPKV